MAKLACHILTFALMLWAAPWTGVDAAHAQGIQAVTKTQVAPSTDVPDLVRAAASPPAAGLDAALQKAMRSREVVRSRPVELDVAVLKALRADAVAGQP